MKRFILAFVFLLINTACMQNAHVVPEPSTTIVESPDMIAMEKKVVMSLSGNPVSYTEGQIVILTVNFDKPTEYVGNFVWNIEGSDKDFQQSAGTVHLPKGSTTFDLQLKILSDTIHELDETFTLLISSSIASNTLSLSVLVPNDDVAPALSIVPSGAREGEQGNIVFNLSSVSHQNILIDYVISDVTTTYGSDLTVPFGQTGTLTIPAGQTSVTLPWSAVNDAGVETITETANITISKNVLSGNFTFTVGGLGSGYQVLTVYDNDLGTVHAYFGTVSQSVNENVGTAFFPVNLNKASVSAVDVYLTVGGVMTNPADHNLAALVVRFEPGETTKTIPVQIVDDSLPELNQSITLNAGSLTTFGATWTGSTISTILVTDNDETPILNLVQSASTFSESAGTITIPFTLDKPNGDNFTIPFTISGTASRYHDYTAVSWTSVSAGVTSGNITIPLLDDARDETEETLILTVGSGGSSFILGTVNSHVVTITDNDNLPTIDVLPVTQKEGCGAVFYVKLSAAAGYPISFNFSTSAGTASAGSDFTTTSGSRVIPSGRQGIGVYVPILIDGVSDSDETFSLNISGINGATVGITSANATIKESFANFTTTTVIGSAGSSSSASAIDANSCYVVSQGNPSTDDSTGFFVYYANLFDTTSIPITDEGETFLSIHSFPENSSRVLMQKYIASPSDLYLMAMNVDGTDKVDLTPTGTAVFNNLKMTSNGQKFIFSAGTVSSTRQDLYLVDVDATSPPTVPFVNCGSNPGCINPTHSMDLVGTKLIYLSDSRVTGQYELYSQDVSGGAATKLHANLPAGRSIKSYQITPNSLKVVYTSDKDNSTLGNHDLFSVNLDGSGEVKINSAGNDGVHSFAMSTNSLKISWVQNAGKAVVANLDGTSQIDIGANDGNHGLHATKLSTLKFSPNHNYVVGCLYDNVSTKYHLYSYKVDGTASVALKDSADVQCNFAFSTDSLIVVYSTGTTLYSLYAESIDGGVETAIHAASSAYSYSILDLESSSGYISYRARVSTIDYNYYRRRKLDGTTTGQIDYSPSFVNTSVFLLNKANNFLIWVGLASPSVRNIN